MIPLRDNIPRIGFPSITWTLIILNGTIFIFEISLPKNILEHAFYLFGLVPPDIPIPRWGLIHDLPFDYYLSFVTSMFLHGGWLHILGNMWFLYLFGSRVEDQMGHIRYLVFYLLSGIAANVIYFLVDIHSTIPGLGASGAIAGVMGAYIVMFPRARILTLIPIFFFHFLWSYPPSFMLDTGSSFSYSQAPFPLPLITPKAVLPGGHMLGDLSQGFCFFPFSEERAFIPPELSRRNLPLHKTLKGEKNEIRYLNFILAFFHFCFDTASFKEAASLWQRDRGLLPHLRKKGTRG